jgi:hypothetical protein
LGYDRVYLGVISALPPKTTDYFPFPLEAMEDCYRIEFDMQNSHFHSACHEVFAPRFELSDKLKRKYKKLSDAMVERWEDKQIAFESSRQVVGKLIAEGKV